MLLVEWAHMWEQKENNLSTNDNGKNIIRSM